MKTVAFVGNPNVGKSALINLLADSDLKVGNWSGVTTEKIEAEYEYGRETYRCVDLPGLYGFNGKKDEERITQQYLETTPVDCLVNVVDSSCLLNNLYCTLQCRQFQIPIVLVLNFEDERLRNGIWIDTQAIARRLSVPLIQMSALDSSQCLSLKELIRRQAQSQVTYRPLLDRDTDQLLTAWMNRQNLDFKEGLRQFEQKYPQRMIQCRSQAVQSFARYVSSKDPRQLKISRQLDTIMLHPLWGYPLAAIFLLLMCSLVFLGSKPLVWGISLLFKGFFWILAPLLKALPLLLQQLILDGFLGAMQAILSFVPLLGLLYGMIAVLEESGYMARIALLADRIMRIFHLSGKAMISLLLGFGCNVPAIASCGALENEKMRRKTALLIPLMSCGGRLPIYFFFIDTFFKGQQVLILFILYGTGVLLACFGSLLLDYKEKKEDAYFEPQMMELPCYRLPRLEIVWKKVKKECQSFLTKTFTMVLWVLLILWALMHIPLGPVENSLLAQFAKKISFLFIPLGFGRYWQLVASLFPALIAKESVVAFLLMLSPDLSFLPAGEKIVALSFMLYCLCTVPCIMTCSIQIQKYGWKQGLQSLLGMLLLPYALCFFVIQFFSVL